MARVARHPQGRWRCLSRPVILPHPAAQWSHTIIHQWAASPASRPPARIYLAAPARTRNHLVDVGARLDVARPDPSVAHLLDGLVDHHLLGPDPHARATSRPPRRGIEAHNSEPGGREGGSYSSLVCSQELHQGHSARKGPAGRDYVCAVRSNEAPRAPGHQSTQQRSAKE